MAEGYWRSVHKRALKDTLHALQLESTERVVVAVIVGILALAVIWLIGGDTGAELGTRVAATAGLLLILPFLYVIRFVRTPAILDQEKGSRATALERELGETRRDTELRTAHVAALREQTEELRRRRELDERAPEPTFHAVQHGNAWCLEIRNNNVDANFSVKLDISRLYLGGTPQFPVNAVWINGVADAERRIPARGWDRAILFETKTTHIMVRNEFIWANNGVIDSRGTTAWIPGNKDVVVATGGFTVFVSSVPAMAGGARPLVFEFKGEQLFIIGGGVQ